VVPTWPLVGRDAELHFVLEAVRGADRTGVVVAGAMGVGKTRLAREAAAALRTDFAVEWTAATPASASIPFGPLAHLLPDLDVSSPDDRLRLLRGITAKLTERAGGAPLALVVDDAQWFDAGAAALVHQLVVSRAGRVLLTVRTGEQAADPIVSLWKDGLVERLELQPLSALELDTLVVSVLDRPVDRSTLGRFWALSRGNPLFVRELLLAALEADAFSERDGVWSWTGAFGSSTRLSAILEIRLGHVSPTGRTVLDHLAVGEPLPLDTLIALCGVEGVARG
jgi:predicted ATPase